MSWVIGPPGCNRHYRMTWTTFRPKDSNLNLHVPLLLGRWKTQCISYGRERNNPFSLRSPFAFWVVHLKRSHWTREWKLVTLQLLAISGEKTPKCTYYLATVVRRELNDTTVQSLDNTTPHGWDFPAGNSTNRIYVCLYNSMAKTATANTQQQHHHQQQHQQQQQ